MAGLLEVKLLEALYVGVGVTWANFKCHVLLEWIESHVFITNFLQFILLYLSRLACLIVTQCQKAINPLT
jgi:hypothetical protein